MNPSGKLPVSLPRSAGSEPFSYLHPALGGDSEVTSISSEPIREFGHGLSYTTFAYSDLAVPAETPTDGFLTVNVTVENTGDRAGDEVVQVYVRDVVGSTTRPVAQLVGFHRVPLGAGESARVALSIPTARLAAADRSLRRSVEPGTVEVWVGTSAVRVLEGATEMVGPVHLVTPDDARLTSSKVAVDV